MEEPSILDYLKTRLRPGQPAAPDRQPEQAAASLVVDVESLPAAPPPTIASEAHRTTSLVRLIPWRSLLALFLALAGQFSLRPVPDRTWLTGTVLLFLAIDMLAWAIYKGEWKSAALPAMSAEADPPGVKLYSLIGGLFLALIGLVALGDLQFNLVNLTLFVLAIGLVVYAFWVPSPEPIFTRAKRRWAGAAALLQPEKTAGDQTEPQKITLRLERNQLLEIIAGVAIVGLVIFFRYFRLADVPPEMNSDHAEKFLDILRVLNGNWNIFFPTNGGREALQFYTAAALHYYAGLPLNFMLLKLVTSAIGFLALPFIYLLGKELGSKRIGWLAFLLAGIAYWPNVVSRFGLRLPFYILFTAMLMYFLVRGLRTGSRNDFLIGGVILGLSFYGYSADRILPLLVVLAVGLFGVHSQAKGRRRSVLFSLMALALIGLVVFLPLARYIIEQPDSFLFRTLTRMGSLERPLERPPLAIFFDNLGRALAMFSWRDGVVWPISIPDYPALATIAGALFYLGAGTLLLRYIWRRRRPDPSQPDEPGQAPDWRRNWLDPFLLLSIPLLMLPSVMALAFPDENPSLYRTAGALVPVFLMAALALDSLIRSIEARLPGRTGVRVAWGLALVLLLFASLQEYNLVFNTYYRQYQKSAWNSSEMGQAARDFIDSVGQPGNVWLVGFPNWVDSRLVANNAGYPGEDWGIMPENLATTIEKSGPKLFIVSPLDETGQNILKQLYPLGWFQHYTSKIETKDFLLFIVPPSADK